MRASGRCLERKVYSSFIFPFLLSPQKEFSTGTLRAAPLIGACARSAAGERKNEFVDSKKSLKPIAGHSGVRSLTSAPKADDCPRQR